VCGDSDGEFWNSKWSAAGRGISSFQISQLLPRVPEEEGEEDGEEEGRRSKRRRKMGKKLTRKKRRKGRRGGGRRWKKKRRSRGVGSG
jgi:hypothetical protein